MPASTNPKKRAAAGTIALIAALLFVTYMWWYIEAEDFSESSVSGIYVVGHDGIAQKLMLHPDHTFEQEDNVNGSSKHGDGTWRIFNSSGSVAFSRSLIDVPDSWRGKDEHEVYGIFKNYFGVVSLSFEADRASVTAFKRPFS